MLVHEKQSVTRTARGASPSGSSFPSSSSRGRKEEENETARKSRRMSSWFLMEGGRGGEGRRGEVTERIRRRRRRRRRGGGATYCPRIHSLFQFKLKPQKKRRAHTYMHVRATDIHIGAHSHSRESWSTGSMRVPPHHLSLLPPPPPPPAPLLSPLSGYCSFSSTSRERVPILSERKYHRHKHR